MEQTDQLVPELMESRKSAVRGCLEKILLSPLFASSPRQKRFLQYVVIHSLEGNASRLKGYTIGVEVFDRGADFDPNLDAIVRVEAARLRNKLREYYENEGRTDPILLDFPKGSYAVRISARESPADSDNSASIEKSRHFDSQPSLAVLPFVNINADPEQDYFVDGITDSLISELSKLSGLFIISRQSSSVYKRSEKRISEIAAELGVSYLLEGGVQRLGNRVRITAQLIDAATDSHIWAERYDRELKDLFDLQDEVAHQIAGTLQVRLTPEETKLYGHERTSNFAAHDALLRGMERHWKYTPLSSNDAVAYFSRALQLDPDYAAAHAWLARTLAFQWIMRLTDDERALEEALIHARRAVELEPNLSYAHSVLGWVQLWRRQGEEAIAACWRGVALDPNSAEAHLFLSNALMAVGRGEEAMFCIEKAMRLSPHPSPFHQVTLGQCYLVLGEYDLAEAAWKRGAALNETFMPNQLYLCLISAYLGRKEESLARRDVALSLLGGNKPSIFYPWLDKRLEAMHLEMVQLACLLPPE
jgi:TolB-like protein